MYRCLCILPLLYEYFEEKQSTKLTYATTKITNRNMFHTLPVNAY